MQAKKHPNWLCGLFLTHRRKFSGFPQKECRASIYKKKIEPPYSFLESSYEVEVLRTRFSHMTFCAMNMLKASKVEMRAARATINLATRASPNACATPNHYHDGHRIFSPVFAYSFGIVG
jgi:hypothetical protein